ncbi:MAG TPA: SDR family NAD(P)-dependent oxidoreductase, partial [Blastocatellia bacterium]|nr:SDR family NAD(P)-dependent oxidoreductase [Blastocatellia bacterium]
MNTPTLENQVAIVTGGARGIGRAIVHAFAASGGDVVIADVLDADAERTAREVADLTGRRVEFIRTDVTNFAAVQNLVEMTLTRFGRIDVLVNSVGWDHLQPFVKTTPELWDKVLNINF